MTVYNVVRITVEYAIYGLVLYVGSYSPRRHFLTVCKGYRHRQLSPGPPPVESLPRASGCQNIQWSQWVPRYA